MPRKTWNSLTWDGREREKWEREKEEAQQSPFVQWSGFTDHLFDERQMSFWLRRLDAGDLDVGYMWLKGLVPDEKEIFVNTNIHGI